MLNMTDQMDRMSDNSRNSKKVKLRSFRLTSKNGRNNDQQSVEGKRKIKIINSQNFNNLVKIAPQNKEMTKKE